MAWLAREELLTYEEIARIARVCVERFGFEAIRLTGGEPTVRAHLPRLVGMLAPLGVDLAMTTNGVAAAGDGARPRRTPACGASTSRSTRCAASVFRELTRRDELDRVLDGIDAALDAGLDPVKVNVVVMRGVNDDEVVDLAAFGRERGVGVRFIEFMPLDADGAVDAATRSSPRTRSSNASTRCSRSSAGRRAITRARRAGRALPLPDGIGEVGVIASVTEPFCEQLRPVRLTAEGKLRTCLFALDETDLRAVLRTVAPTTTSPSTTGSRPRSRGRSAPSGPATTSARSTSSGPTGR